MGPDEVDGGLGGGPHGGPPEVDVLGVGFGPSNLALALAVAEHNERVGPDEQVRAAFVEQQARFGWHRGMLLDGATMQVSFLKDLVTMRDPRSSRSFLVYLAERDRLADFINRGSLYPPRVEFHDYLEWCAAGVRDQVSYGTRAVAVHPVPAADGTVDRLDVELRDADGEARRTVRTRHLVLATGLVPWLPPGAERGPRVWHNSELLPRLAGLGPGPHRFVVVGAGQSAAETARHLHAHHDEAQVHAVFSRYGYSPADDTAFVNRIFDPDAVDHFHEAPDGVKRMLRDLHANTNYSVVDPELIDELYHRSYEEKVRGRERLHVHGTCRVTAVRAGEAADGPLAVDIAFLPTGERRTLTADVVVYATGYRPIDPTGLLGDVGAWCRRDDDGELQVRRDYRLVTAEPLRAGIFLQGPTEHTHGLGSTLLSTTAVRAGEILDAVLGDGGTAEDDTRTRVPDAAAVAP